MMRKILFILSILLAVLALSQVSIGTHGSDDDLRISRALIVNDGNIHETRDMVTRINLQNLGNSGLSGVKVTVTVPELGLRRSVGPFNVDVDSQVLRNVVLEMVEDVPAGEYYVKIEARNDQHRKTTYRLVTVQ